MPVEFECPHCQALVEQTKKNRVLPRIECKKCGQAFSTQWASKPADVALPRGAVVSERFELGRNFCNKLWNAARFALMNLEGYRPGTVAGDQLAIEDRWILSRLATVTAASTEALAGYRYADAARVLYDFAWNEFCSFYVEMAKARLQDTASRATAQRVLAYTLDVLVRLLHPMIPFLTEEVWQLLGQVAPRRGLTEIETAAESVMIAPWPAVDAARQDAEIEARFARFQEVLEGLRKVRSERNIPPKDSLRFSARSDTDSTDLLKPMWAKFESLAGASVVEWGPMVTGPPSGPTFVLPWAEVFVDLTGHIDIAAEIDRKLKELEGIEARIAAKSRTLDNANFVARAPADVIAKERAALEHLHVVQGSTQASLEELRRMQK
jgi:valyl-tRNA synthetase